MHRILQYLRLVRPEQWIKNAFVLAPLIFSRELFQAEPLLTALRAAGGFCLAAGAVYSINDLADLRADRTHPVKKNRPIAAGTVGPAEAVGIAAVLLIASFALTSGLATAYTLCLAGYVGINILYSLKLKELVLIDVFLIASGFMLRVLGGAYAIAVPVSGWIVLCTLFISLFLGFGKRRAELVLTGNDSDSPGPERKVLHLYSVGFLDQMLTISAAAAVITYALYTVAPSTYAVFKTDKVIYTTVFVIFGVFRYLYLVHTHRPTDNPTVTVTRDLPILITGLAWILVCSVLIYLH
jgi:4-hydroxybenzoate polyprenyltransferase